MLLPIQVHGPTEIYSWTQGYAPLIYTKISTSLSDLTNETKSVESTTYEVPHYVIFSHCPLSYTVTLLSLRFGYSLQQPAAEHARCMTISLDSIAAPVLLAQAKVKLLAPLFSETILSQTVIVF